MIYQAVIVEDDPMVLTINRKYIEKDSRFEVCAAFRDGRSALEYLENNKVDLLLLDIYMPVFTGLDLLKALRLRNIGVRVIMITAANDSRSLESAMNLGIVDYLIKPFEYKRLKKSLDLFVSQVSAVKRAESSHRLYQRDVDRIFLDTVSAENMQKGIHEKTLEMIRDYVRRAGNRPLSSEEVAENNGLSTVTARKYMNYLAENHEVVSTIDYRTGGRPCILYRCNTE